MKLIIDHLIQLKIIIRSWIYAPLEGHSNLGYNEKMIPMKGYRTVLVTQRKHK
jgi:hypothetical protein